MPADTSAQLLQFFACIISGAAIGVLYNFFAAIRRSFSLKKIATFILDVAFWNAGTITFFCILNVACDGEITWYGFAGVLLGLVLYLVSASRIVYPLMLGFMRIFKRIGMLWIRIFVTPFYKIAKACCRLLRPAKKLAQNTRKKASNFVKNNVEKLRRISILLRKI